MNSRLLDRLKDSFLDLLFPLSCVGCGKEGELLCPACCRSLPAVKLPVCQRCGAPVDAGSLCRACIASPLVIETIRSPFLFRGVVRQSILQFKYRHLKAMAAPLGRLLADFIHSNPIPCDVVVPVPLYPRRLRQRGYNQAALLAGEFATLAGLQVREDCLVRVRDTISQARSASAAERRRNVHEAFACTRQLSGERVLLIDDVCTTGATLDACALALRKGGAGPVKGLTVARDCFSLSTSPR